MWGLSPRGRGNRSVWSSQRIELGSIPAWAGEPVTPCTNSKALGVYPRVGGGTQPDEHARRLVEGLSPRGRGNPLVPVRCRAGKGSIPAWAGEPVYGILNSSSKAVYPRVGGGTCCLRHPRTRGWGLSPRGRGNRSGGIGPNHPLGSIPAWAGEPLTQTNQAEACRVYPRVGGGNQ